jgi:transposase-like protein
VDADGDVIDILVQSRRNRGAAARCFRKLLTEQGRAPRRLITGQLRSCAPNWSCQVESLWVSHWRYRAFVDVRTLPP